MVEPAVPENIGAAARALNTMGFNELRLVNPTNHLADEAKWLAHGSVEILENARLYSNFNEAIRDLDFVIATTAKKRSSKYDYYSPEAVKGIVESKGNSINEIGIVFGREASGLTNEELSLCDIASTISLNKPYPSLNLAQSVMLFAYVFSSLQNTDDENNTINKVDGRIYHELKLKSQLILQQSGISSDSVLYHRMLERIATTNEDDAKLFLSFAKKFMLEFE